MIFVEKLFKFLASLKLAVMIVVLLGIISAWGTIVESRFDAMTAQKLVYHSIYMYVVLGLLIVNLTAVMVDRLPWKKHHAGFIFAHIGIIILLLGSYITKIVGIDGTLVFDIGESQRYVSLLDQNELVLYHMKSFDESEKVFQENVDFMSHSPKDNEFVVNAGGETFRFIDYMPYAQKSYQVIESSREMDGPAVRFQLKNNFVNMTEWIVQMGTEPAKLNLGPAQVVLSRNDSYQSLGGMNEIVIWPHVKKDFLNYKILNKEGKSTKTGVVHYSEGISTGWMGTEFKGVQFFPKARVQYDYKPLEKPNATSVSAAQFVFRGKTQWIGLNTALELYGDSDVFFVTYGNRRIDLGFPITLKKFEMEKYQGTEMAASYKSIVSVENLNDYEISMNEPLKYKGFTFYQSSFQQDRMGNPTGSVLSVNKDPGRVWKYLGSFFIVLGSIMLFYFKRSKQKEKVSDA